MPLKSKKSNQGEVADDFDDMLAGFRAADLASAPPNHVAPLLADDAPLSTARAQGPEETVLEATILAAIRAGDLTRLRRWHRHGNRYSANTVCNAAIFGSIAVLRYLVQELGADVNGVHGDGYTPVLVASLKGNLNLVRYLVKTLGADVSKASAKGASPLSVAAQNGYREVVRCLLKDLGADVNQAPDHGTTPLMLAAVKGHLAVVQFLVREHFADINQVRRDGATALILAAQTGILNVVQCLVEDFGAKVNQKDYDGTTALMIASYSNHKKVSRWLLKNGADVQASSAYGTTVDASRVGGAPIAQTEYLEAKAHCSNPSCCGVGLKKCTGCKQARYCGQVCQLAHWKAHKGDCKMRNEA
jgi:ankyrin repeat protein